MDYTAAFVNLGRPIFGQISRFTTHNGTDAGRARNRRVELVKQ